MFANVTLSLMGGFVTTVQLFCLTLVFALPLGLLISFGSMSRITPLRALIKIIVWIVRGTPLMLQIIIIFYGPALLWDIPCRASPLHWWRLSSTTPAISRKSSAAAFRVSRAVSMRPVRCSA